MKKELVEKLARELMERYDLFKHGFIFKWSNTKSKDDIAWVIADENERTLNLYSRRVCQKSPNRIEQIVRHEICHAISFIRNNYIWPFTTYKRNGKTIKRENVHNKEWKLICDELGVKNKTPYI